MLIAIAILLIIIIALLCKKRRREGFTANSPSPYCNDQPGKPFCSTAHRCSACLTTEDCSPNLYCDTDGNCVSCLRDQDCGSGYCRDGHCVACDTNQDCINAGTGSICDTSVPNHHLCVECSIDGDCGDPAQFQCLGGECVPRCLTSKDCQGTTRPNCINGLCVTCTSSNDCATSLPATPECANGLCVQCTSNGECPVDPDDPGQANLKVCAGTICVQCGGDSPDAGNAYCVANYPATPWCVGITTPGGPTQLCVQCRSGSDCGNVPGAPYCLNGSCVGCVTDGQCSEGQHCGTGNKCMTCDATHGCQPGYFCDINGQCVQCESEADCSSQSGGRTHCQLSTNSCVVCRGSQDCGGETPYCAPDGSGCYACVGNQNCASPDWLCSQSADAKGNCVECDSLSDCVDSSKPYCVNHRCQACDQTGGCPAGTVCDLAHGQCVECNGSLDCPTSKPYCVQNQCMACLVDNQCNTDPLHSVCLNGQCAECNPADNKPGTIVPSIGSNPVCLALGSDGKVGPYDINCSASGQCYNPM